MQAREHWIIYAAPSYSVQHIGTNKIYKSSNTSREFVKRQQQQQHTRAQEEAWQKLCQYQDTHFKIRDTRKKEQQMDTPEHTHAVKLLAKSKHRIGDEIQKKKKRKNDDKDSSSSSSEDEDANAKFAQFAFSSEQIQQEHHRLVQRERQKKQQNDNTLLLLWWFNFLLLGTIYNWYLIHGPVNRKCGQWCLWHGVLCFGP